MPTIDDLKKMQRDAAGALHRRLNGRPSKQLLYPPQICGTCTSRETQGNGSKPVCALVGKHWTAGRDVKQADPACSKYERRTA